MKPMEEMIMAGNQNPNPNPSPNANPNPPPTPPSAAEAQRAPGPGLPAAATERKATPQKQKAINCPRCNSTNTKFCYYNNYSLQQPRYFCKTCRRYWTDGGSLRNLPVGGGSWKKKRSSSSSVVSSAASTLAAVYGTVPVGEMHQGANDLKLAFPHHHSRVLHPSEHIPRAGGAMAANDAGGGRGMGAFWAMELLRSTYCYLPQVQLGMPPEYHQQVQNMLRFSLDTGGGSEAGGYGAGLQGAQESATGRLLFPLEDLKPGVNAAGGVASGGGDHFEHSKDQGGGSGHETLGFWDNSMPGNGSSNGAGVGGGSWYDGP